MGFKTPLACLWGCNGGPQGGGRAILRSRSASPPPRGLTRHAKFRIAQRPTKARNAGKFDLYMPTEGPPLQTAVKSETPASVRPPKWPLWRSDSPPPTACRPMVVFGLLTVSMTSSLVLGQRPIARRPTLGIAHSQWAASGPPSQWAAIGRAGRRVHTVTRSGRAGQLAVMGRPADRVLNGPVQPRCLLAI